MAGSADSEGLGRTVDDQTNGAERELEHEEGEPGLVAVGEERDDHDEDERDDIVRHREELSLGAGVVSEPGDEGGRNERNGVERDDNSQVVADREVSLPRRERRRDVLLADVFGLADLGVVGGAAVDEPLLLLLREPVALVGVV